MHLQSQCCTAYEWEVPPFSRRSASSCQRTACDWEVPPFSRWSASSSQCTACDWEVPPFSRWSASSCQRTACDWEVPPFSRWSASSCQCTACDWEVPPFSRWSASSCQRTGHRSVRCALNEYAYSYLHVYMYLCFILAVHNIGILVGRAVPAQTLDMLHVYSPLPPPTHTLFSHYCWPCCPVDEPCRASFTATKILSSCPTQGSP